MLVSVSIDSTHFAAAIQECLVAVFHCASDSHHITKLLVDSPSAVTSLLWHPDNCVLYIGCAGGEVRIFDVVS